MTAAATIEASPRRAPSEAPALIELRDLRTEIYAGAAVVRAVDGVSFSVAAGEMLGVVGESGCGKSMTAYSIMRLLPSGGHIAGGSILFGGRDLAKFTPAEMRSIRGNEIGIVFQDPMTSLNPTMTLFDQVAEPLRLHRRMTPEAVRARVIETLQLVGMPHAEERLGQFPHELSGGLRQRVCIAIALVCEPKLLIADEPTTALDVTIQRQILELIDRLRRRLGMAVILVTHDLGVVAGHTDRVAVMYAGRIVETATTADLFARPRHRYTEGLFAALPERAGSRDRPLYSIPGRPPDLTAPPPGCRFAPRCGHATDVCRTTVPPVVRLEAGHEHRCFHPVETAAVAAEARVADDGSVPAAASSRTIVTVERVSREYRLGGGGWFGGPARRLSAVADVSFTIAAGRTFGLVGESGCGKSTIARMVAGLDRPSSGRITVDGEDLFALSRKEMQRRRRSVHLMFQDSAAAMDPRLRAAAIVREPFEIQKTAARAKQGAMIAALFDQVGLPLSAGERYPHELSGGQRQRLALARALALKPKLVVADEPVSALDVSVQAQILNLMRDLQRSHGLSYLFVSHDLSVVRYVSDAIGVMYLGKLVEIGPAERVHAAPRHPYTRGLIESAPSARVGAERGPPMQGELASAINPPSGCRFHTRCPNAQAVCARLEPLLDTASDGHRTACHFPLHPAAGS